MPSILISKEVGELELYNHCTIGTYSMCMYAAGSCMYLIGFTACGIHNSALAVAMFVATYLPN